MPQGFPDGKPHNKEVPGPKETEIRRQGCEGKLRKTGPWGRARSATALRRPRSCLLTDHVLPCCPPPFARERSASAPSKAANTPWSMTCQVSPGCHAERCLQCCSRPMKHACVQTAATVSVPQHAPSTHVPCAPSSLVLQAPPGSTHGKEGRAPREEGASTKRRGRSSLPALPGSAMRRRHMIKCLHGGPSLLDSRPCCKLPPLLGCCCCGRHHRWVPWNVCPSGRNTG